MSKKIRIKNSTNNNHRSNWILTVNTNKGDVLNVRKELQNAIDNIFSDSNLITNWIVFRQGDWDSIVDFEIGKPVIEIGPETGYVHCHCIINVVHKCNIILNKAQIDKDFSDQLGYSVYSSFKLLNNYQKKNEDYAVKSLN